VAESKPRIVWETCERRKLMPCSLAANDPGGILLHMASSEPSVATACNLLECTVKRNKKVPLVAVRSNGRTFNGQFLECCDSHAFPQFVRERNDEFLERWVKVCPLSM